MKRTIEERLLNPKPGSKIAAAKEFGIDLTLLAENLHKTPQQKLENLQMFELNMKLLLESLTKNQVDFVVLGELAMFAHGWKAVESKLEIYHLLDYQNLSKIVTVLSEFSPKPRGRLENSIFIWNEQTLRNETNLNLKTGIGNIDLLGEVAGVGDFRAVEANSVEMKICDVFVKVISLNDLINAKTAAGRTKDLLVLPELEALRELLTEED